MPNVISRASLSYRDVRGFSQQVRFFVSYDNGNDGETVIEAVRVAVAGLTNAVSNGGVGVGFLPPKSTLYGTSGTYSSIEDKANFTFVDTAGAIHRFQVPAPKAAIFLADGLTVDPANALVVAYVNAITTAAAGPSFVCSRAGNQINFFAAGLRIRRRQQRRVNAFTLNPSLSGPDE